MLSVTMCVQLNELIIIVIISSSTVSFSMEIIQPDDFHHHLRDGEVLRDVIQHASRVFARLLVMPNLKPPIRNLKEAMEYRDRIMSHIPSSKADKFTPLMTLYLTDRTTSQDIIEGKESGFVIACKLYPAGATTNSEYGVTSMANLDGVFKVSSTNIS
jgi:dihydroorotase